MIETFKTLIVYLKKPDCGLLKITKKEKLTLLLQLFVISFAVSFTLGLLISILEQFGVFEIDSHAISKLLKEKSKIVVFLMGVVAAPVAEELIFRGPLSLFCNKKSFRFVFYGFSLLFGFAHIANYDLSLSIIIASPLLISPQIALGLILSYTRIKLGLIYSISLHMLFNGILLTPSLLML